MKNQYTKQDEITRIKGRGRKRIKSYVEIGKQNGPPPYEQKNSTNPVTEQQKHMFHHQKKIQIKTRILPSFL